MGGPGQNGPFQAAVYVRAVQDLSKRGSKKGSKMGQKGVKKGPILTPKNHPKWPFLHEWAPLKSKMGPFLTPFWPFLDPFLTHFWAIFGTPFGRALFRTLKFDGDLACILAQTVKKGSKRGPKMGPFLGPKMGQKWAILGVPGALPGVPRTPDLGSQGPGTPKMGYFGLFWASQGHYGPFGPIWARPCTGPMDT